jgi:hypothetical protein
LPIDRYPRFDAARGTRSSPGLGPDQSLRRHR